MNRYEQRKKRKLFPIMMAILVIILIILTFWLNKSDQSENKSENKAIELPQQQEKQTDFKIDVAPSDSLKTDVNTPVADLFGDSVEDLQIKVELPSLENSDGAISRAVQGVSKNLTDWFQVKQAIRKYIMIINDISQKQLNYKHRRFLKMPSKMVVKQDSQGLYLAPESYKRYDTLANAIAAINVQHGLSLYLRFKPLFSQVYEEFNYPEEYKLDDIFIKAAASVIDAPVINKRIALIPHAVRYKYAEEKLENLNDVKKLMLRMGPKNTQKIQNKLRQLVEALSVINE